MKPLSDLFIPEHTVNRLYGVVVGIVTNNQDPEQLGRVKLFFPWLSHEDESDWARVATVMAGGDRGAYFLPEVNDEVLVAFEQGDVRFPYVLGCLWNGKDKPPENNEDGANNLRMLKSRSGHLIRLDDTPGEEKLDIIAHDGRSRITFNRAEGLVIKAEGDVTIQSSDGKLTLSGSAIEMTSAADIKVKSQGNMDLEASAQLNLKGGLVNIN